jgi:hypothetical protein
MILLRTARLREIIPIDAILEKLERIQGQGFPSQDISTGFNMASTTPNKIQTLKEPQPAYSKQTQPEKSEEKAVEKEASPVPVSDPPIDPSAPKGAEPFSKEGLLEFIREQNLPLATYLTHADLRFVDENTLEWDFKNNTFHLELLESNSNKKKLEVICQDFFKRKVKVLFVGRGKENPKAKRAEGAVPKRPQRLSIKEVLDQPRIKDLIDIFQAEVVDIKMPPENKT